MTRSREGTAEPHQYSMLWQLSQHAPRVVCYASGRQVLFVIVALILSLGVPIAHANNASHLRGWQTQVPDALAPVGDDVNAMTTLVNEGVLTYPHPQKNVKIQLVGRKRSMVKRSVQFVSSAVILQAPPHKVKSALTNYAAYPSIFPKLVKSKVLAEKGNLARVKYRAVIDIPVPILKFDETFTLRHQVKENSLTTWIEYSPIKYGMGQFQWHAITSGKYKGSTLLTLTHWAALDDMRGIVLPQMVKAMPSIKLSIPNGVNGYVLEALRLHFNGKDKVKTYSKKSIHPSWQVSPQAKQVLSKLTKHTHRLPVMYAHPPRKLKGETILRFVSSLQFMPASKQRVNDWLMSPTRYPKLIKHVKKVDATPYKTGHLITTKIKVGLGVIAIPFKTKLYFQRPSEDHAMFSARGGDVRWIEGEFKTWQGKTANTSYLMTTIASKTDKKAPFLLRIGHALPYNDYLSSVGVAPVLSYKVKKKLK